MGEGGALIINNPEYNDRAEIIREKGTNRSRFFRGQVDKYTWVDKGSSYLPSDMSAAYLWGQLESADIINDDRMATWERYYDAFLPLKKAGLVQLPSLPNDCTHNAHMFYLVCDDLAQRSRLIEYLKERGVMSVFHYIPLHSSPAGMRFGRFHGPDEQTTSISERLTRLPLYYGMSEDDVQQVIDGVLAFYQEETI